MRRGLVAILVLSAALMLGVVSTPLLAHGDKPHGENGSEEQSTATATSQPVEAQDAASSEVAESETAHEAEGDLLTVLGNLHPATVHFPIALLLAAGLTEAFSAFRLTPGLRSAVSAMAVLGAGGAVIAAGFGWYHTGLWLGGESTMQWHRWTGTALAVLSLVAAWLALRAGEGGRGPLRAMLALVCLSMVPQAYWGAELAHGHNHLFASH